LIDSSKIKPNSYVRDVISGIKYEYVRFIDGTYCFSAFFYTNATDAECFLLNATNSIGVNTIFQNNKYPATNDYSTAVVASGRILRLYY